MLKISVEARKAMRVLRKNTGLGFKRQIVVSCLKNKNLFDP